jgi:large subunit ribosomal protein L13
MSIKSIIDADGLVLGRMASSIAKRLLAGEYIDIVNAQNIVVSGNRIKLIEEWKEFMKVGGFGKGPTHYRKPNDIVRRTIRGMLPYRIPKGRDAYKRLNVYIGVPEELKSSEKLSLPECHSSKLRHRYTTVGELAMSIGWNMKGAE